MLRKRITVILVVLLSLIVISGCQGTGSREVEDHMVSPLNGEVPEEANEEIFELIGTLPGGDYVYNVYRFPNTNPSTTKFWCYLVTFSYVGKIRPSGLDPVPAPAISCP